MEKDKNALNAEREKALELAIAKIKKEHGEGSIMKMSEESVRKVDVIPTGCLPLDLALGIGGMPKGRIVEIYGPESSGKTTLTLHVIAQAQKAGGKVAFVHIGLMQGEGDLQTLQQARGIGLGYFFAAHSACDKLVIETGDGVIWPASRP